MEKRYISYNFGESDPVQSHLLEKIVVLRAFLIDRKFRQRLLHFFQEAVSSTIYYLNKYRIQQYYYRKQTIPLRYQLAFHLSQVN